MKNNAFTLAEVLITLGIIGIVAAMTLPIVVEKKKKKEIVTLYKKIYSVLKNAEMRATVDYGDSKYWDYSDPKTFMRVYYIPYLNVIETTKMKDYNVKNLNGDNIGSWYKPENAQLSSDQYFISADGMNFKYWQNNQYLVLSVDVNGAKNPNTFGKDIWDFELLWDGNKKLVPKGNNIVYNNDVNRYVNLCKNFTTRDGSGCYCSGLFMWNDYSFDSPYPW